MDAYDPERYYIDSMYFVSNKRDHDFLAKIIREEGGNWKLTFRFSSYTDPRPFNDSDKRDYYQVETDSSDDATLLRLRDAMVGLRPKMEEQYKNQMDVVELQCWNNDSKMLFEVGSRPWANVKYEPIEQGGGS